MDKASPAQYEVVAVCRGNIGRSVAVHVLLERAFATLNQELEEMGVEGRWAVSSAGVQGTPVDPVPVAHPNITHYEQMDADARPVLERLGIYQDLARHTSRPITEEIAARSTLMLAADERTRGGLQTLFPEHAHKIHLLSRLIGEAVGVPDPDGADGPKRQEHIFTTIQRIIEQGLDVLPDLVFDYTPELLDLSAQLAATASSEAIDQEFHDRLLARWLAVGAEIKAAQQTPDA